MQFVANTAFNKCENDNFRDQYVIYKVQHLIDKQFLGQKSGSGFYKKIDKGLIHVFDFEKMDYRLAKKRFKAITLAKETNNLKVILMGPQFFATMRQEIFCQSHHNHYNIVLL